MENLDVRGTIYIAPNVNDVKIKNVRVSGSTKLYLVDDRGTNLTIEDSELIGVGMPVPTDAVNLTRGSLTLLRDEIAHVRNGANLHAPALIQDCWIHGLVNNGGSHNEDLYIGTGHHIRIIHNTLENEQPQTATIFIKTDFGPIDDILIEQNLLAGGGYMVYGGATGPHGAATAIRVIDNTFSRRFFARGGRFGVRAAWPHTAGTAWSGNHWEDGTSAD